MRIRDVPLWLRFPVTMPNVSDLCKRLRCMIACCGSTVVLHQHGNPSEYPEENGEGEEPYGPSTIAEEEEEEDGEKEGP